MSPLEQLSEITAHQDEELHPHTRWSLRQGRPCCARAATVACNCLQSFTCPRHGRHCFGPHDWTQFYREESDGDHRSAA